jgi:hypothetical protein
MEDPLGEPGSSPSRRCLPTIGQARAGQHPYKASKNRQRIRLRARKSGYFNRELLLPLPRAGISAALGRRQEHQGFSIPARTSFVPAVLTSLPPH